MSAFAANEMANSRNISFRCENLIMDYMVALSGGRCLTKKFIETLFYINVMIKSLNK